MSLPYAVVPGAGAPAALAGVAMVTGETEDAKAERINTRVAAMVVSRPGRMVGASCTMPQTQELYAASTAALRATRGQRTPSTTMARRLPTAQMATDKAGDVSSARSAAARNAIPLAATESAPARPKTLPRMCAGMTSEKVDCRGSMNACSTPHTNHNSQVTASGGAKMVLSLIH